MNKLFKSSWFITLAPIALNMLAEYVCDIQRRKECREMVREEVKIAMEGNENEEV